MILLVSAYKPTERKMITGYLDSGDMPVFSIDGFLRYLNDKGYRDPKIIYPSKGFDRKELQSMEDMQPDFASAIGSLEYYPDTKENNWLRVLYVRSHPYSQDFTVPKKNQGSVHQ